MNVILLFGIGLTLPSSPHSPSDVNGKVVSEEEQVLKILIMIMTMAFLPFEITCTINHS